MSANKIIAELDAEQMTKDIPAFAPGDTVVVQVKVKEGNRERLQAFEGVCIGKRQVRTRFGSPPMAATGYSCCSRWFSASATEDSLHCHQQR